MTDISEDYEGGTSGSLTTGNTTFDGIGGAHPPVFAAAPSGRTGYVGQFDAGYTANAKWDVSIDGPILTGKVYLRDYVRFSGTLQQYAKILGAMDQQGAYIMNGFNSWATTPGLRLVSLTGNSGSTYTCSLDTWYRLELDIDYDAKTVQGRIYLGDETSPVSTQNATWTTIARTNVNGQCDCVWMENQATSAGNIYHDDTAFSTTAQPGSSGGIQPNQIDAAITINGG